MVVNGRSPSLHLLPIPLLTLVALAAAVILIAPQMPRLRDFDETFYPAARDRRLVGLTLDGGLRLG